MEQPPGSVVKKVTLRNAPVLGRDSEDFYSLYTIGKELGRGANQKRAREEDGERESVSECESERESERAPARARE